MNPNYTHTIFRAESSPAIWPKSFAVITAHNPNGVLHSKADNQKFDGQLQSALEQDGISYWRVTGGSPDFQHAEPGFAVEISIEAALAFGNCYQQEAIFWIEEGTLFIISCDGKERMQLGEWSPCKAHFS